MERLFRFVLGFAAAGFLVLLPMTTWGAETRTLDSTIIKKPAPTPRPAGGTKSAKPDLVVSKINFSPGRPMVDDEITLWIFVKNVGRAGAGESKVRVKVGGESNPPVIAVPALNPGQEFRYTKRLGFNRAGNFIVTATADALNGIVETVEDNNVNTATITVNPAPKPDLVISKINYSPGKPTVNDEITFWVFVKNAGNGRAGASKMQFRIGGESNPALISVPALPPGNEYRFTRKATLGRAQNYQVRAIADYAKNVSETDETNNAAKKRVRVIEARKPQGLDVNIKSVNWNRATKTWVATIRNDGSVTAKISIAGFPLENGAPGMTFWANDVNLVPNHETQLTGDYSSFEVPPGTRLKVHVILKPSDTKLDEKIIVMD